MAKVNGEPVHCLLDSGCERSVITKSIVPNVKLSPSRYILSTANKMDLPILGDIDLSPLPTKWTFPFLETLISRSPSMDTGLWLTSLYRLPLTSSSFGVTGLSKLEQSRTLPK